tara:strand:+ start:160 stop:954 length:795 start_codon:yes stop_codon:yes gene_type:complete
MIDIRLKDNLDLMAEIKDNTVDLIYCDILYGTGRKFKDYQDLKPKREVIEEHYIPRIKEMHRILKDTGSIYLQMDTRINHWLRCILDDVFGYGNFLNEISWCYDTGGRSRTKYPDKHDIILFYSKSKKYIFNSNEIRIQGNTGFNGCLGGKQGIDEDGRRFYDKKIKEKYYRYYYDVGKIPESWWKDIKPIYSQGNERNGYNTQKPKALLERIIKASSNEGDLVADFYGGSFTTAEVCKDLHRNFIGCDISGKAVSIGLKRTKY